MDIDRLREFVKLGEHLNFTRAAQESYIAQSTLSDHITALEKELGFKLVNRTASGVDLTDPGWTLFDKAQQILDIYDDALLRCKSASARVNVRICDIATAYGLAPVFDTAARRLATEGDSYHLSFVGSQHKTVEDLLLDGDADIGFTACIQGDEPLLDKTDALRTFFVKTLPLRVYALRNSPLAQMNQPSIDALDGMRIVVSNQPFFKSERDCIRDIFAETGVKVGYKMFRAESQLDRLPLDDNSLLFITPAYVAVYRSVWGGDADDIVEVDVEGLSTGLDYYGVYRGDAAPALLKLIDTIGSR